MAAVSASLVRTTVIAHEPVEIRTIMREPVQPAQAMVEYYISTRLPKNAQLDAMWQQVAVEVPMIGACE